MAGFYLDLAVFFPPSQANQEVNVHQFAITSVSIAVLTRSAHKPQFPMSQYDGILSTVGTMAENKNDMGTLLRILATDEDYGPGVKFPLGTSVYWLIPNLRYAALAVHLCSLVLNPVVSSLWHTIVDIQHNICFNGRHWNVLWVWKLKRWCLYFFHKG